MNRNLIWKSTVICFKTCPWDSLFLVIVSVVMSIIPSIVLLIYNSLIANINFYFIACIFLFLYCLVLFFKKIMYNFYNHYFLNYKTLLKFEKGVKHYFFDVCYKLPYESYLYPQIVNETRRAQNASVNIFRLYQIIVEIFSSILGAIFIGTAIVHIDCSLIVFLVLSIVSPVIDNIYKIIQKKYLLYQNTQAQKEEQAFSDLLTKSNFLKEIRELRAFSFIHQKWANIRDSIVREKSISDKKVLIVSFIMNVARILSTSAAYYSVTSLFINNQINIAEFSMIILTFSQITQFFNEIFSLFGNLSEFSIMIKPFFEFLQRVKDDHEEKFDDNQSNSIILEGVSFKYPNSEERALDDISLTIKRGEMVSIVGENGSGKTTLSNIIMGFLSPTSGNIVNSICCSSNGAEFDNVTSIPQDLNCYSVSIKDNIVFGKDVDESELIGMLNSVGLTELKEMLNRNYGLEFGGIELSGGQKQKIAILRGINKKCDLLICDEPTSAIDPIQESSINNEILKLSNLYTTIVISHRLNLTKYSDQIIVLSKGKIVENGTHHELIEKGGVYSEMWGSQFELYG